MPINQEKRWLFSSESVTEGHPDKVCDQISDAVLDAILAQDKDARVACETIVTTGLVFVTGEISTSAYVDISGIVRKVLHDIGYDGIDVGFDADTCAVLTSICDQSPDISQGVSQALELRKEDAEREEYTPGTLDFAEDDLSTGAGDQGMMFGFACNETAELMPLPITLAHGICRRLSQLRKQNILPELRPDGKAQVTVEYCGTHVKRVHTVVVSTQHAASYSPEKLREDVIREVVKKVIPADLLDDQTRILVNPTGRFVVGGPQGDSGLTGRKLIVDTYGGMAAHGGGSFSGKDPTKVDRSASYAARYIAKHLVAAGVAERIQIQLAYAIGVASPISISVDTYGTAKLPDDAIVDLIETHFPLTPAGIIQALDLRKPIYTPTASYGHFGRSDLDLSWERLDRLERIKTDLKNKYPEIFQ